MRSAGFVTPYVHWCRGCWWRWLGGGSGRQSASSPGEAEEPLRIYRVRCPLFQIRSWDLRNSPSFNGLANSRLLRVLPIHQICRPLKTKANTPS